MLNWIKDFEKPLSIASVIRDYPRIPKSVQPPYLPPETKALLEEISHDEKTPNLFVQLDNILTWISSDIIKLIVAYYPCFLWLEWADCFQLKLSQFEGYSLYTQFMIKNFFILLISLDKKPDQPIVLQESFWESKNTTKNDFKRYKDPHTAAEFLISEGIYYNYSQSQYCLRDMLKDVGLEKKSNALLQETLLLIDGYKKFTLKNSDFDLLSQIYENSHSLEKIGREIETFPQLLEFFNHPGLRDTQIPFFSEEKKGEYSVIASGNKYLPDILSNLPVLEQEWIEFKEIRAKPLGTKTLALITTNLIIFPSSICETISSYLYLNPTQTGSDLANQVCKLLIKLTIQNVKDTGLNDNQYIFLREAMVAIGKQSSLITYLDNQEDQQICYPNPMKVIGRMSHVTKSLEDRVWVIGLKIMLIQMMNFCQAYTREVTPYYRSELFQNFKNTPPSQAGVSDLKSSNLRLAG